MIPTSLFTRRQFLNTSLTALSASATMPLFLQRSALAVNAANKTGGNILVVVQFSGGNDGLNTLIPYRDDAYRKARPTLGIPDEQIVKFDSKQEIGMHPSLAPLAKLYDRGIVSLLQGVGYPNPNRSHFKSMDIWHTGDLEGRGTGWLGKHFDAKAGKAEPDPNQCITIGRQAPLATLGSKFAPISFEDETLFRWAGADLHDDLDRSYQKVNRAGVVGGADKNSSLGFLMRTALDAQVGSERIRKAVQAAPANRTAGPGPRGGGGQNNQLANNLAMIAAMIKADLPTSVYYTELGSFDTHSAQQLTHANLLTSYAQALTSFYDELKAQGNAGRVIVMSFSEFGRRVGQNASQGTDHGVAGPMFLVGDPIKPGVHGAHPSLTDLDQGDLKTHTDFRSVYATLLENWLHADSAPVLGEKFKTLDLIKA